MRMTKSGVAAAVFASALGMSGCASMTPQAPPIAQEPWTAFDQAAMQAGMQQGHAIVRGQAFAKTVGGDVKYGAGNDILVLPYTDYASECLVIIARNTSTCVEKLKPYARKVQADGEGRFEVVDLAPGRYLLSTIISWGVPGPFGVESTGGPVTAVVEVKSDTDIVTANLN